MRGGILYLDWEIWGTGLLVPNRRKEEEGRRKRVERKTMMSERGGNFENKEIYCKNAA
jgi:hypothetical protein